MKTNGSLVSSVWLRSAFLVVLLALIAIGMPSVASARVVSGDTEDVSALPIPCDQGSLTLSLPKSNPYSTYSSREMTDLHEPTGEGFEVTARRVEDINLEDAQDIEAIDKMTPEEAQSHGLAEETFTGVTGADRSVTFDRMPVGLYLVEATAPQDPEVIITDVEPFLLTVPIAEDGHWACDVNVTAKQFTYYSADTPPTPPENPPAPPENPPVPKLSKTGSVIVGVIGMSIVLVGIGGVARRQSKIREDRGCAR